MVAGEETPPMPGRRKRKIVGRTHRFKRYPKGFKMFNKMDEEIYELYNKKTARQRKEEDLVQEIKLAYGRRWRAGLKEHARKRYRKKKTASIDVADMARTEKDTIKLFILASGSVQERYNTCGHASCQCMNGGRKHGPYYYLSLPLPKEMVEAGMPRMKHFYITKFEAIEFQRRIENLRALQDQVWDEIWDDFMNAEKGLLEE